ncbi:MAG: hypothetical protein HY875_10080 [Chloroflexi bacterium]|nr:hypothetical protein [Chloroflexota bacterium]
MNILTRGMLAFYSLLLLAAAAGFGLLAWDDEDKLDLQVRDFNLQALIDTHDAERWVFTGILAAIGLLGLLTLILAFLPARKRRGDSLRMRQADGGYVEVTAEAMEMLIRDELESLPDIRRAIPAVRLEKGAVATDLDLAIEASAVISQVTASASEATRRVLSEQVGVADIRRPSVRIRYDDLSARPAGLVGRTKPQQEAQPPAASTTGDAGTGDESTGDSGR